jgi:hypothetical protein
VVVADVIVMVEAQHVEAQHVEAEHVMVMVKAKVKVKNALHVKKDATTKKELVVIKNLKL